MLSVLFDNDGYKCFNERYWLFKDDNSHSNIFDFINIDLSPITKLLEKYFSYHIDEITFMIVLRKFPKYDTLNEIKSFLCLAHPYFRTDVDRYVIDLIAEFLNYKLLYAVHNNRLPHISLDSITEEWYKEALDALLTKTLRRRMSELGITSDYYMDDFIRQNNSYKGYLPEYIPSVIKLQNKIANILYFTLDTDAEGLNGLTLQQRFILYKNIFRTSLTLTNNLGITEPEEMVNERFRPDDSFIFEALRSLENVNIPRDGLPVTSQKTLGYAVDEIKAVTFSRLYYEYKINDLSELLTLEVLIMIDSQIKIRKCKNCGKYFITSSRKVSYCNRMDEDGKLCSEIGPSTNFKKKTEKDKHLKMYVRAYKTHYARYSSGLMSKDDLNTWRQKAKAKLKDVRNGSLSNEKFMEWLKI